MSYRFELSVSAEGGKLLCDEEPLSASAKPHPDSTGVCWQVDKRRLIAAGLYDEELASLRKLRAENAQLRELAGELLEAQRRQMRCIKALQELNAIDA